MTDFQKEIYNSHLAVSRKAEGKPFRLRQNFDDFDQGKVDVLGNLETLFKNHSIDPDNFFSAPFKVFPDENYKPLEFFITQKAKKIYSQWMKMREFEDPESRESLKRLVKSLKFVYDFCIEKGLTLAEYPVYIEDNLPSMISHLKNHNINMYTLHALGVSKVDVENRILDFLFGDFWITFQKTKNKFYLSSQMKLVANLTLAKLEALTNKNNKTKTDEQ